MAGLRILVVFLALIFVLFGFSEAREILVGGHDNAWKVPPSANETLDLWSHKLRFQVGDVLVWKYDPKQDSVLEVTEAAYNSCTTANPVKENKDGNTKIELNHSGPFYFISGAQGHCEQGQKLKVVVLSENHKPKTPAPAPVAPAPGPTADAYGLRSGVLGALIGLGVVFLI